MAQQNDDGGADAGGTANEQEPAAAVTDAEKAAAATEAATAWETGAAGMDGWVTGTREGVGPGVDPGVVSEGDTGYFGNLRPDTDKPFNPSKW